MTYFNLGPLFFGLAFDIIGGYQEVLRPLLIFPAMGIVAAFLASKPNKRAYRD
jgi:hypothetical protein